MTAPPHLLSLFLFSIAADLSGRDFLLGLATALSFRAHEVGRFGQRKFSGAQGKGNPSPRRVRHALARAGGVGEIEER